MKNYNHAQVMSELKKCTEKYNDLTATQKSLGYTIHLLCNKRNELRKTNKETDGIEHICRSIHMLDMKYKDIKLERSNLTNKIQVLKSNLCSTQCYYSLRYKFNIGDYVTFYDGYGMTTGDILRIEEDEKHRFIATIRLGTRESIKKECGYFIGYCDISGIKLAE